MNPLRIQAMNLRTFAELKLAIPAGCCVIGGENGAGKSTILSAIDVALFAGRGELPPLLTLGEDELTLELVFEHAGHEYRVRRGYSAKGRGKTTLDLEEGDGGFSDHDGRRLPSSDWRPLTRETADQTQQHLEQILGLSRATFRASSFLAQGDGAAFTEASPRDRKAILAEILGLEVWDRLLTRAKTDLRAVEDETTGLRARADRLQDEIDAADLIAERLEEARGVLAAAVDQHTYAAAQLERALAEQAANEAAGERWRAADNQLANAKDKQESARQFYAVAVNAAAERERRLEALGELTNMAAAIPRLEEQVALARESLQKATHRDQLRREAEQRELARDRLARQADVLFDKAAHIEAHIDESATCDRCGQTLGAEAAALAIENLRAEANQLAAGNAAEIAAIAALVREANAIVVPATIIPDVALLEQALADARQASEQRAALAEQVRQLGERAEQEDACALALADAAELVKAAEAAVVAAGEQVADPAELQLAVSQARRAADATQASVDLDRAAVTRLEVAEQRAQSAAVELAALVGAIGEFQRRTDILKLAERAYGRDGIPALIVESAAIPQLEMEANRILGELGGATAGCRVELRTQRALKTTDALRETLDIVIVTGAGERAYETFSGGERTRLNLALRIALARLLAHRRGAESRLLAIDEPDGLDAQGMDALARILQGLGGDFDKILVVSHQPQLATSFDQTIMVVKDGERSAVAAGSPLEGPPEELAA